MTVSIISTRKEYLCDSDDDKPTENILSGSFMYEVDTGLSYIYNGDAWTEKRDPAPLAFIELMAIQKDVLEQLQTQLEIMNVYLSTLTDDTVKQEDLE